MLPSGIRPQNPSKREAADLSRPRGHWDQQIEHFAHFTDTIPYCQINAPAKSCRVSYVSFFSWPHVTEVYSLYLMILPELIQFRRNYTHHLNPYIKYLQWVFDLLLDSADGAADWICQKSVRKHFPDNIWTMLLPKAEYKM